MGKQITEPLPMYMTVKEYNRAVADGRVTEKQTSGYDCYHMSDSFIGSKQVFISMKGLK